MSFNLLFFLKASDDFASMSEIKAEISSKSNSHFSDKMQQATLIYNAVISEHKLSFFL
jgi:hypothetical protein